MKDLSFVLVYISSFFISFSILPSARAEVALNENAISKSSYFSFAKNVGNLDKMLAIPPSSYLDTSSFSENRLPLPNSHGIRKRSSVYRRRSRPNQRHPFVPFVKRTSWRERASVNDKTWDSKYNNHPNRKWWFQKFSF